MSSKKNCFNCTRAKEYPGTWGGLHEPPAPPEADCTLENAEIEDALEMAAEAENIYLTSSHPWGGSHRERTREARRLWFRDRPGAALRAHA
jgi:hypothetical protein